MRIPGVPYVQGRNSYPDGDGKKYGIAIHNTSNDASDSGEASYATRRTDGVSSHFYCDSDSVTQSLDTDARAGHAGSRTGNENAIAIEITGANGWTRRQWLDNVAWGRLADVLAVLCRYYSIEPRRATVAEMQANPRVRAFYGHDDMRRAWGGTTHTDPGPNFPWDHLIAEVQRALTGAPDKEDDVSRQDVVEGLYVALVYAADPSKAPDAEAAKIGRQTRDALRAIIGMETTSPAELTAALAAAGPATAQQVAAGVLAELTPERIAALVPQAMAREVADELAARLRD